MTVGNDLYLWVIGASAPTTPTGWVLKASNTTTDAKSYLFKRTADGTEGSSLTVSWATNPNQVTVELVPVAGQTTGEVYGTFATNTGAVNSIATTDAEADARTDAES